MPYEDVDLVVVRENTEGLYSGLEHVVVPGVVESLRIITRAAAERIVRYAFELARQQGRRRVTFCHKADVLPLSDGLFLATARAVADDYPFLEFEEMHVDALCLQLALDPIALRRAGDGEPVRRRDQRPVRRAWSAAWAWCREPTSARATPSSRRSTAAPRTSPARAWPTRSPCCARRRMMLEHIGQREPARRIEESVRRTLQAGRGLTRDLGGDGTTATLTEQLIANL